MDMITTGASGPISLSAYNEEDCMFMNNLLTEDEVAESARTVGAKTAKDATDELKKDVPNSTSFAGYVVPRPPEARKFEAKAGQKPKTKVEVEVLKVHVGDTVYPRLQLAIGGFDADMRKQWASNETISDIHYIFHRLRQDVIQVLSKSSVDKNVPDVAHPALAEASLSAEFLALLPDDAARKRLQPVRLNLIPDYHMPDAKSRVEYKNKNNGNDYPFAPPYLEGTALENRIRAALQQPRVLRCVEEVIMTACRYLDPRKIVPGKRIEFNTTAPVSIGQVGLGVTGLVHVASIQVLNPEPSGGIPVKCIEYWQVKGNVTLVGGSMDKGSTVASHIVHATRPVITPEFMASVEAAIARVSRSGGDENEVVVDDARAPSFSVPVVPFQELLHALCNNAGARCIMSLDRPELPASATADDITAAGEEFDHRLTFIPKDSPDQKKAIRLDTTGNVFSWSSPVFTRLPDKKLRVDLRGLCVCKITVAVYDALNAAFALNKYSVSNWRDLATRVLPYIRGVLYLGLNAAKTPGFRSRVTPGVQSLISQYNVTFAEYRTAVEGVYEFPYQPEALTPVQARATKAIFDLQPVEALQTFTRALVFEPKEIIADVGIRVSRQSATFILQKQATKQGLSDPPGGNVVSDLRNLSVRAVGEGATPESKPEELKGDWQFYYVGPVQSEYSKDGAKANVALCRRLESGKAGFKAGANSDGSVYDFIFSPEYDQLRQGLAIDRENVLINKGVDDLILRANVDVSRFPGIVYALRGILTKEQKEAVVSRAMESIRPMVSPSVGDKRLTGKETPAIRSGPDAVSSVMATEDLPDPVAAANPKKRKSPEPKIADVDNSMSDAADSSVEGEDDDVVETTPTKVFKRIAEDEDSQWAD